MHYIKCTSFSDLFNYVFNVPGDRFVRRRRDALLWFVDNNHVSPVSRHELSTVRVSTLKTVKDEGSEKLSTWKSLHLCATASLKRMRNLVICTPFPEISITFARVPPRSLELLWSSLIHLTLSPLRYTHSKFLNVSSSSVGYKNGRFPVLILPTLKPGLTFHF